jgi:hypothetical protein
MSPFRRLIAFEFVHAQFRGDAHNAKKNRFLNNIALPRAWASLMPAREPIEQIIASVRQYGSSRLMSATLEQLGASRIGTAVNKRLDETRGAIIEALLHAKASPVVPVSLYEIGVVLSSANFSQEEIVRALFSLEHDRVIELVDDNHIRVMHYMTDPDAELA